MTDLRFLAPWSLAALFVLPLLAAAYSLAVRRRARAFAVHPDAGALAALARRPSPVPPLAYLGAAALALVATARPTAPWPVRDAGAAVAIALESGASMMRSDILPSRLEAARAAVAGIVRALPVGARVALVTFGAGTAVPVPLTEERERVLAAVQAVELGPGYSFADGFQEAVREVATDRRALERRAASVVLISHGHNREGADPLAVAAEAARLGIRVFAIGVGVRGSNFDDEPLKRIADLTGGRYYPVASAEELERAYRSLSTVVGWRVQRTEVTGMLGLAGALALALSLLVGARTRRLA